MDLYNAARNGNLARVTLLVEQGADKNQVGGDTLWMETVLSTAAHQGHLDVVRYLVEQGADMEKCDSTGWTPLFYASAHGHLDVVRYLL